MNKLYLGCHLSIARGFTAAAHDAIRIDATSFQFFTRNPRGGAAKAYAAQDLAECADLLQEHQFGPLLAHAPYTMNLGSAKEEVRRFALDTLKDDYERVQRLPYEARYLFHPGSHIGSGTEQGIDHIVEALNLVIKEEDGPWVLLEGMTGKGSEIGSTFEELKQIMEGVTHTKKLGICIDTCHLHAAGYDIVNQPRQVLGELDRVIGLSKVMGVHVNDNKNQLNSHKDRHAPIGEGTIGTEAIVNFINQPELAGLPFNLETPNELEGYAAEIALLRRLSGNR
ncbi:MAG: deoxyribonuclease IV [Negativicutes bacterium]|nr:deoxyribonuclease IV [Negativicutes bacterium]